MDFLLPYKLWFLVPFWTALAVGVVMALRRHLSRKREEKHRARSDAAAWLFQRQLKLTAESKAERAAWQRWDEALGVERVD